MTAKSLPHICYSYHTDSGDGQSMRTKGAARSHKILLDFLHTVGTNIEMDDELSLNLSIMEDTRAGVVKSKKVKKAVTSRYGKPVSHPEVISHNLLEWRHLEEYLHWSFKKEKLETALEYVDSLGTLADLTYRPPLYATVSYRFDLKQVAEMQGERSYALAFLSPSSNKIVLRLATSFTECGAEFKKFRTDMQRVCPIPLNDKRFYYESTATSGRTHYRKVF